MLLAVFVLPLVLRSVGPLFDSLAVLFILDPFAYIGGSICMFVGSVSMCFIVVPRTFIYVSVCMDKNAMAVCLVLTPLAIVLAAILPYLLPVPILLALQQLSCIDGSVAQSDRTVVLSYVVAHHFTRYSGDRADGCPASVLIQNLAWPVGIIESRYHRLRNTLIVVPVLGRIAILALVRRGHALQNAVDLIRICSTMLELLRLPSVLYIW